eukprot:1158707-Pelagomonas_calceolata.AAC.2
MFTSGHALAHDRQGTANMSVLQYIMLGDEELTIPATTTRESAWKCISIHPQQAREASKKVDSCTDMSKSVHHDAGMH